MILTGLFGSFTALAHFDCRNLLRGRNRISQIFSCGATFRSFFQVIEVAQFFGEQICPALKCTRIEPNHFDDLEIPATLDIASHRHRAAKPLSCHRF